MANYNGGKRDGRAECNGREMITDLRRGTEEDRTAGPGGKADVCGGGKVKKKCTWGIAGVVR